MCWKVARPSITADVDAVRETRFVTPTDAEVPLHAFVDIRRDRGPTRRPVTILNMVASSKEPMVTAQD